MEEQLKQQFDELGIEPTDEVIEKCVGMCLIYKIEDAAEFVEQWVAYSASHLNGEDPNEDNLTEFDRKILQTKREKENASMGKKNIAYSKVSQGLSHANNSTSDSLAIYGFDQNTSRNVLSMDDNSMLQTYNLPRTPESKSSFPRTPARRADSLFNTASYSPTTAGTPRSHLAVSGTGKIIYTFGNGTLIANAQWSSKQKEMVTVTPLLGSVSQQLYMLDRLSGKCEIFGDRALKMRTKYKNKIIMEEDTISESNPIPQTSSVKLFGTVYCDHGGRLDVSSTMLLESDDMACRTVSLNLSKLRSIALYPGQNIIASGSHAKGDVLIVDEIIGCDDNPLPKPPELRNQISFVIASGPYTSDDDLIYDPLHDLLAHVKEETPDVLILLGPFMDSAHKLITDCSALAESFESFFDKILSGIVETVGTSVQILIVPCYHDANTDVVYPTMPPTLKKTYSNVFMLSDPTMVDLNGIVIGMTSVDTFDHLATHELAVNAGDKVKRIVNYIMESGSFYPLNPPAEEMCLDSGLAESHAIMKQIPHILILPSTQKCFIRVVNGCLAINPGRIVNNGRGSFARMIVTPATPKEEISIFNYIACQILNI